VSCTRLSDGRSLRTVIVRSRTALPAGRYAYKHIVTTNRPGERFQMLRAVNVA
jgi:hypothetical protein